MSGLDSRICVCICTYKRPSFIERLLESLRAQKTEGRFEYTIAVCDNDVEESARRVVEDFGASTAIDTGYCVERTPSFSLARNMVLRHAVGDYLAFIDDDELPEEDWLLQMFNSCSGPGISGVLAPVLPHFDGRPPKWLVKGGFYDRPRHRTGFVMDWQESRTGNVMIKGEIIAGLDEVFRPQFGEGGEDQDFFRRMMEEGHTFIWCDEAPVRETVPPHRWKLSFLLKRALLRGQLTCNQRQGRLRNVLKSLVAVPLYGIALPVLCLFGSHVFMRYFVRFFDHLGRLLAVLRLNPVEERCH